MSIKQASFVASLIWFSIMLLFILNYFFGEQYGLTKFLFPLVFALGIVGVLIVIFNKSKIDAAIEKDKTSNKNLRTLEE
jgi:anaerobic C4-dicarboxylate transporter